MCPKGSDTAIYRTLQRANRSIGFVSCQEYLNKRTQKERGAEAPLSKLACSYEFASFVLRLTQLE
jgi:hypothetical protein